MRRKSPYMLQSVDRALVLVHLLRDQGSLTVADAARSLGVGQSTAHRLLSTLVYRDFAKQDEDRCYRSGPALGIPPGPGQRVAVLRELLAPHLDEIRDHTGETVNLSVRVGCLARIVATAESRQALHVGDQVGTMLPAHLSAVGKAELAWVPPCEVQDLVTGLSRPVDVNALLQDLSVSRRRGYALNNGRAEEGVSAVGVALRNQDGEPVGALAVAMPSKRFTPETRQEAANALGAVVMKVRPKLRFALDSR